MWQKLALFVNVERAVALCAPTRAALESGNVAAEHTARHTALLQYVTQVDCVAMFRHDVWAVARRLTAAQLSWKYVCRQQHQPAPATTTISSEQHAQQLTAQSAQSAERERQLWREWWPPVDGEGAHASVASRAVCRWRVYPTASCNPILPVSWFRDRRRWPYWHVTFGCRAAATASAPGGGCRLRVRRQSLQARRQSSLQWPAAHAGYQRLCDSRRAELKPTELQRLVCMAQWVVRLASGVLLQWRPWPHRISIVDICTRGAAGRESLLVDACTVSTCIDVLLYFICICVCVCVCVCTLYLHVANIHSSFFLIFTHLLALSLNHVDNSWFAGLAMMAAQRHSLCAPCFILCTTSREFARLTSIFSFLFGMTVI